MAAAARGRVFPACSRGPLNDLGPSGEPRPRIGPVSRQEVQQPTLADFGQASGWRVHAHPTSKKGSTKTSKPLFITHNLSGKRSVEFDQTHTRPGTPSYRQPVCVAEPVRKPPGMLKTSQQVSGTQWGATLRQWISAASKTLGFSNPSPAAFLP